MLRVYQSLSFKAPANKKSALLHVIAVTRYLRRQLRSHNQYIKTRPSLLILTMSPNDGSCSEPFRVAVDCFIPVSERLRTSTVRRPALYSRNKHIACFIVGHESARPDLPIWAQIIISISPMKLLRTWLGVSMPAGIISAHSTENGAKKPCV